MMPRSISLIVLTGLIACLGLAFLRVLQPFLLPLLLAAVVAMLLQPVLRFFLSRTGGRSALAAGLTTASLLAVVLLPILFGVILGTTQLYDWSSELLTSNRSRKVFERMYAELQVGNIVHNLQPWLGSKVDPQKLEVSISQTVKENLPKMLETLAERTLGLAASTFGLLGMLVELSVTLSVFITAVYFFLADGPALLAGTQDLLPVQREHQDKLLDQFVRVTRAVVLGTFAAAVAQGLATGIGLYFAGIERVVLLTVLATVVAVVPVAGTSLVWIPCAVWMCFAREAWFYPVTLFVVYNVFLVASLDNLVRAYVLNSDVKLHPLLAFISVLGGLQWLGLWGVFVGPVLASCLYAIMKIFKEELTLYAQQTAPAVAGTAVVSVDPTTTLSTPPLSSLQPPVIESPPPAATVKAATSTRKPRKRR